MGAAAVLCNPAVAQGMQSVLELPKRVAVEIEACDELSGQRSKDTPEVAVMADVHTHRRATACAMESAASSTGTMRA